MNKTMVFAAACCFALLVVGVVLDGETPPSPSPSPSPSPRSESVTAIEDVRLFTGQEIVEKSTVIVKGQRIIAVGQNLTIPENARRLNGEGKTLLPGFIDAHTHSFGDALERALYFGVTTQIDMFSDPGWAAQQRSEQSAGVTHRADLLSAGILATAPGGHGTQFGMKIPTLLEPKNAQSWVKARLEEGSDFIKIVLEDGSAFGLETASLDEATVQALVESTHQAEALAVVHVSRQIHGAMALDAGADGLVHLFGDSPITPDLVKRMADSNFFVIPTLTVIESTTGVASGVSLTQDAAFEQRLTTREISSLKQTFPNGSSSLLKTAASNLLALHQAGVPVLAGTDAPNPGTSYGVSMHRELELLVQAGLSPLEALRAATETPALAFGLEDRGRIAPGLLADLILVEGRPDEDILDTRSIANLWRRGREVSRPPAAQQAALSPARIGPGFISHFENSHIDSRFGSSWQESTDAMQGGSSTVSLSATETGAQGSTRALLIQGQVRKDFAYPWSGAIFFPGEIPMAPTDISTVNELRFWARGEGGPFRVMIFAENLGFIPSQASFNADGNWREIVLPFTEFPNLDSSGIKGVFIGGGAQLGGFTLAIDEVEIR